MTAEGPSGTPQIRVAGADDVAALASLWRAFYADQRDHGMLVDIPPDGFELWAASLAPALGRFACLVIAEQQGTALGFVAGRIRTAPRHLGGGSAGYISEVFVDPGARKAGLATRMIEEVLAWFAAEGVHRVELDVVAGNAAVRAFYTRLGFVEELTQMVRIAPR